jgi:hypothetical protein
VTLEALSPAAASAAVQPSDGGEFLWRRPRSAATHAPDSAAVMLLEAAAAAVWGAAAACLHPARAAGSHAAVGDEELLALCRLTRRCDHLQLAARSPHTAQCVAGALAALMTDHHVAVAMTTLSDPTHRLAALKSFRSAYAGLHTVRKGLRLERAPEKRWHMSRTVVKAAARIGQGGNPLLHLLRSPAKGRTADTMAAETQTLAVKLRMRHLWSVARQAVVPLPPREALKAALRMAGPLRGTAAAAAGLLAMHEASYAAASLQQPQPQPNTDARLLVEADTLAALLAAREDAGGEPTQVSAAAALVLDETVAAGAMYLCVPPRPQGTAQCGALVALLQPPQRASVLQFAAAAVWCLARGDTAHAAAQRGEVCVGVLPQGTLHRPHPHTATPS